MATRTGICVYDFNGEPALLHGQILPALQRLLAPQLQAQLLHRIEVFTYQREVERYGGPVADVAIRADFSL